MANMTSSVSASQVAGELASATFEEIPALVEHYREDPRQQVIKACERALKRHAKELAERERVNDMYLRSRTATECWCTQSGIR